MFAIKLLSQINYYHIYGLYLSWDTMYNVLLINKVNLSIYLCSTMGVGCQSRRFNCLFWRETRQRILGHEISPYPEVVRGGEWELTTRPRREQLVVGQEQRQLVAGEQRGKQQKRNWRGRTEGQSTPYY